MTLHTAIETLYNQCREAQRCLVLIDPQVGDEFKELMGSLNERSAPHVHLKDLIFAETPDQAPFLLSVPLSELPVLEDLAAQAQREAMDAWDTTRGVCGFLQSALPLDRLAGRLSSALDLRVDTRNIYFRYFDPRTIHHLPNLMPRGALGGRLLGVSRWSYFLWDGTLATHEFPEVPPPVAAGWRITAEEWFTLESIEHFNATQRLFARMGLPFEPARTQALFAQVHATRPLGLRSAADTAYYLAYSQVAGMPLTQHPQWPDVVALAQSDVPLSQAAKQLCAISLLRAG